jgi:hypothetical protein
MLLLFLHLPSILLRRKPFANLRRGASQKTKLWSQRQGWAMTLAAIPAKIQAKI